MGGSHNMNSLVHAWGPWFSISRLAQVRLFDALVKFPLWWLAAALFRCFQPVLRWGGQEVCIPIVKSKEHGVLVIKRVSFIERCRSDQAAGLLFDEVN